jgi:hypothetical protein
LRDAIIHIDALADIALTKLVLSFITVWQRTGIGLQGVVHDMQDHKGTALVIPKIGLGVGLQSPCSQQGWEQGRRLSRHGGRPRLYHSLEWTVKADGIVVVVITTSTARNDLLDSEQTWRFLHGTSNNVGNQTTGAVVDLKGTI